MNNNDIIVLLYKIKENIKKIEKGSFENSVIDDINVDFIALLELIKLFLISERDSYYGYFLINMQFKTNFYSNSIAGIKLNEFPPVFESNPLLLCKFSLKKIIYIVCHEIDHVIFNHPAEMLKANPTGDQDIFYQFNLAADAAVNDRINYEIKKEKHAFMEKPEGIITSQVISKMFDLGRISAMENYEYYFRLIKESNKNIDYSQNGQEVIMQKQNQKDGNISKENNSFNENNKTLQTGGQGDEKKLANDEFKKNIVTAKNCNGNISDHQWETGNDVEDVTAAVKEFVNISVGMMNDESRGLMPAYFMSEVEKINKPAVLPWQAMLKKYVGTIKTNKRKTRMRLNRRQPERFELLGSVDDKVLKIIVAIDTSASVDDYMIGIIMNEIFAILAKRKHDITIIECDAEVQRVYKVKTPNDIKKKVVGRGGTSFTPVITYINNDKYYRDALLIYFTDGYGELKIPRPRTYRNMWVVLNKASNLSIKEPYGIVLTL